MVARVRLLTIITVLIGCVGCDQIKEKASALKDSPQSPSEKESTTPADLEVPVIDPATLMGKTSSEVETLLGKPIGKMGSSRGSAWTFAGYYVEFSKEDKVTRAIKNNQRKHNVANSGTVPITKHADGGKKVDIKTLMPEGSITIVDFYADWCGPCKVLSPSLEQIAKTDPDVVLRKVDIVNWDTPVVAQYKIKSVPNVRIYNRDKKQIGDPTHALSAIKANIAKAKKE